jgi:hypothetical protein
LAFDRFKALLDSVTKVEVSENSADASVAVAHIGADAQARAAEESAKKEPVQ